MTTAQLGIRSGNTIVPLSSGSMMPAGTIISYSGSIASFISTASADSTALVHKDGWAVCNGASIARATYADLYARLTSTWNAATNPLTGSAQAAPADTGVNFRIPNLQGTFLRGVGDFTDASKDTTLAGFQVDIFQGHSHTMEVGYGANSGTRVASTTLGASTVTSSVNGEAATPFALGANGDPRYGTETRPQNVGVYYLVKLYDNLAAADVYIAPASATAVGLVDTSAQSFAGVKTFNDGVKLGAGNATLKCKILTGITGASEGDSVTVAHGLTGNNILGWTSKVIYSANSGVPSNYTSVTENEYFVQHDATEFIVTLANTNSGSILSKTFYIMVWYA